MYVTKDKHYRCENSEMNGCLLLQLTWFTITVKNENSSEVCVICECPFLSLSNSEFTLYNPNPCRFCSHMSAPTKFPKQTHSRQTAQTLAHGENTLLYACNCETLLQWAVIMLEEFDRLGCLLWSLCNGLEWPKTFGILLCTRDTSLRSCYKAKRQLGGKRI